MIYDRALNLNLKILWSFVVMSSELLPPWGGTLKNHCKNGFYLHYELDASEWNGVGVELFRWVFSFTIFDELDSIICDYEPAKHLLARVIIVFL